MPPFTKKIWVFLNLLIWVLVPQSPQAQDGKHKILLSKSVFFESGKHQLRPNFYPNLDTAAKLLQTNKTTKLWVHSHTDSVGSNAYNDSLSANRAKSVLNYLQSKLSLPPERLQVRNYGEYSPLADDGDEKGRAENRRVMVYVVEPFEFATSLRISGKVIDNQTKKGIPNAKLLFVGGLGKKDSLETDSLGNYQYQHPRIEQIETRAYAKGYFFLSKISPKNEPNCTLNFSLEPCLLGAKLALQNLYFYGGSAQLTLASEAGLDGIYEFLKFNDQLKIEIGGHVNKPNADPVPVEDESYKLSESRARTVREQLIKRGIPAERLLYKGYGNWEMIHPQANNTTQEQMNRRVELKIVQ